MLSVHRMSMRSSPSSVDQVIARIRNVYRNWNRQTPIQQMRRDWDEFLWCDPLTPRTEEVDIDGLKARWIDADGARNDFVLLYFHGGGYKMGSVVSHHELMSRLSAAAGCRVLGINYRLLPEWVFPAPVNDACRVYRWLLDQGYCANHIALAGDSSGGGIAAATLISSRDQGVPLPAAAVLLSALTDFETRGASYESRAALDPIHNRKLIQVLGQQYLGREGDVRHPLASPLNGELQGLPPLLLQVGDRETGLDDSVLFAEKAARAGVEVILEIWDGMIHVFQLFPAELIEAQDAINRIGEFLKAKWSIS
ncbi:MAG: alpha/beta hydrolase [Sinobacteraceae bacterium]|nr:alpha/beta hydrolase [Nevskiaceae bacterium]